MPNSMIQVATYICISMVIFSHHQKYLLKKTPEMFKVHHEELVTSSVATRLNGYCGKLSDLDKEIDSFGLDKQLQFELCKVVHRAILPLEPLASNCQSIVYYEASESHQSLLNLFGVCTML